MTRISTRKTTFLVAASLCMGLAAANCSSTKNTTSTANLDVGSVNLALSLPNGSTVSSVNWVVQDSATPPVTVASGVINTSDPNATPSVDVGIAQGTNYTVTLTATTSDGLACTGKSAPFNVTATQSVQVSVTLVCGGGTPPQNKGSVIVNGTVVVGDNCPLLTSWVASPLQTSAPAGKIDVAVTATDSDVGEILTYAWTATAGSYVDATKATTQYICTTGGAQTLTVTVTDNHQPSNCKVTQTFPVTCVNLLCGNGVLDPGEACDASAPNDPNKNNCDANCHVLCGNGHLDGAEQCDPPKPGFCSATCQNVPPVCGDGFVQAGEACEPPNTATCSATCQSIDQCLACEGASTKRQCKATLTHGPNGLLGCAGFTDPTQKAACVALLSCIRTNHCASGDDPTPCLCGALDPVACSSAATLPGVCAAKYADAFNALHATGDTVFTLFVDPSSPIGIADNLTTCDVDAPCTAVCTQ